MTLLQVAKFYPPESGGIESVTQQIREQLGAAGIQNSVVAFTRRRVDPSEARQGIHRCRALFTAASAPIAPGYPIEAMRQLRRHEVAIFHLPNPFAILPALFVRKKKAKWVLWWHSDVIRQRLLHLVNRPLERWLLRRCDAVFAASPVHLAASEHAELMRGKGRVVPFSPHRRYYQLTPGDRGRIRAVQKAYAGRRIIFACGRLVYYKGFEVLLEAARKLPENAIVLIAGAGPLKARLEALRAQWGLEDRVRLLGRLEDEALLAHLGACRVFCLPSTHRSEMFGVVQIEAMALARPVVSTDIPGSGVPWVNRHGRTGLVVPPNDAASLTKALTRVCSNEGLWSRLSRGAKRDADTRFHPDVVARQFLKELSKI